MKDVKSKRVRQSHLGLFNSQGLLDDKESLFPKLTNFPRKFKLVVIIPEVVFRDAITHYHKLGGLRQQKWILSRFWRLKPRCRMGWFSLDDLN